LGLYLIAVIDWNWWWNALLAIMALGAVIFVHELGHFLVAKACGVKVEKFYLGFDIAGIKIIRFRRGETEYGVGILPLGGYVKMLGQDDNPGRIEDEIERSRLPAQDEAPAAETSGAAAPAAFDPRSYLAKPVPQRMAIISAGVIMNLIFAFACAVLAYRLGVEQVVCGVGEVLPGEAAWQSNIRPGDDIIEINGKPVSRYVDLQRNVSLGDLQTGVALLIRRPGVKEPIALTVFPEKGKEVPRIGVVPPRTTTLASFDLSGVPGSPVDLAQPAFEPGDQLVAINDKPIDSVVQLDAAQAGNPSAPLKVTIARRPKNAQPDAPAQRLDITVAPRPMKTLGLVMKMGEVSSVQKDSPAAKAGVKPGDYIERIDNSASLTDPLRLPARLGRPGDTIALTVSREGSKAPLELPVTLRKVDWMEEPLGFGAAMPAPALGLTYRVLNRVHEVEQGSPAAAAGIVAGDVIVAAQFVYPQPIPARYKDAPLLEKPIVFGETQRNWPFFMNYLQQAIPGTKVELVLERDKKKVTLEAMAAKDWFNPDRGFLLETKTFTQRANSWGEALVLGGRETLESTTMVFSVLGKLGRQISLRALNGPWEILKAARRAAQEGPSRLLLLLTMISANLAVINFLPIPVLDGGHMVFLAYEWIRGKPASPQVQLVLTYLGLFLILSLMVWVLGLDFGLISRRAG